MATRTKLAPADVFGDDPPTAIPGTRQLIVDESDDQQPEMETAVERIQRMLREVSDDDQAVVKLYRVIGPNKYEWCDDYTPDEFERGGQKLIRDKWGAAEYQIRLIGNRPKANGQVIRCVLAKDNQRIAASSEPTPVAPQTSDLAHILATMAEQQQQMLRAITERPPAPDPMAQMSQMLAMMTAMRGAMGLDAQKPAEKSQLSDIVAAIRELREVSSEINPPPPPASDDPMAMLPQILDLVKTGMQRNSAPIETAPPVQLVTLPPSAVSPAAAPVVQPASEPDNIVQEMRDMLAEIVTLAAASAEPQAGADILYERLPDELIEHLRAPQWFQMLQGLAPEVAPHFAWLTTARDLALAMFDEPEEVESAPVDASPSSSNPP